MTIKSFLPLLFILCTTSLVAKDLFWIGNSGEWSNKANWSLTSGGNPAYILPTPTDRAVFDNQSFSNIHQKVVFSQVAVKAIVVNSNMYPQFSGQMLTVSEGIDFQKVLVFNADITCKSAGQGIINTGGFMLDSDFFIESGDWEIENHLILGNENLFAASCNKLNVNQNTIRAKSILAEKVKLNATDASFHTLEHLDLSTAIKKGGDINFIQSENQIASEVGDWFSSIVSTRQTCGTVTVTAAVTSDYNGEEISCNNACDAEVTVTLTGSSIGPFGYSLNSQSGPFQSSNILTGVCAGGQTVWVIDSSQTTSPGNFVTCDENILPSQPFALSFSIAPNSVINPSCPEICDGSAIINPNNGTGAISVVWDNGETGNNPLMLCTGSNPFTLTDVNNCTLTAAVVISAPIPIVYDLSVTELTCNGDSDAEILISNEAGGNGAPFSITYSPAPVSGQNSNNGIGFSSGNITVTVSDIDGCQQDSIITIEDPPLFVAGTADLQDLTCFGICNGQISALPSGGVPGYTYEWFDNSTGLTLGITDSIATGLCAGEYFVTMTDANGCIKQSPVVTVGEPLPFLLNTSKTDVECLDLCTGIVVSAPAGGTPTYTFSWRNIANNAIVGTTPSVSDLCAGDYEITVTDFNGCVSEPDTVEVLNGLPLDIVFTATNPSCYDICDGEITATPTNQSGHTFSWSNGGNTSTITSLCVAGNYVVTVTSDLGCVEIDSFNFTAPVLFDINTSQMDLLCFGDTDGHIVVEVIEGGNGPVFTYDWTVVASPGDALNGDFTDSIFNLTDQTYELVVTDGPGGCDTTMLFTITSPPELTITAVDIQDLACADICNGQVSALPVGGVPPYSYQWFDNVTGLFTGITDSIATGLCGGDYFVVVTDNNNCTATSPVITIASPLPLILTLSKVDLNCVDICDGEASSVVTGGTLNYTYAWVDLATTLNVGATPNLTNLCPGDYQLTVVDANNCPAVVDTVTVLNALPIDVSLTGTDPTCYDLCDGTINVATVNSSGFTYVWTPTVTGQGTANATDLCADINYVVEVTDLFGCIEKDSLTLATIPEYDIIAIVEDVTCFGDGDGSIALTINGGASGVSYNFNWVSLGGNPITGQGTATVSSLLQGDYTVTISDVLSCDTILNFTIISPLDLEVNTADISQITCFGECDGQISVLPSGGNPGYTYEWIDNATGIVISTDSIVVNLCAGDYYVRAIDTKGCVDSSAVITIIEPAPLNVVASATDISCNGICDGTAQVTVVGGTPIFFYTWSNTATNVNVGNGESLTGLCPGEYQIVITDGTGCVTEPDTVEVGDQLPFEMTVTGIDPNCPGICNGSITAVTTNGQAPFTWSPIPAAGQSAASATYSNLCEDFYTILVEDNAGCIAEDTVTLNSPAPFDITVTQNDLQCFGDNSGSISTVVNAGGNGGPYTYNWLPSGVVGFGTNAITNLIIGNYQVTISDGTCDTTLNFNITEPDELLVEAAIISNSLCEGSCSGSAEVTVSGGAPAYSILWTDPLASTTGVIANLCPDNYFVTVTDQNNCTKTDSVEVIETDGFVFNVATTDVNCFGDCDGTATISMITGATPTYTVQWNDPNSQTTLSATNLCAGTYEATLTDINNCDTVITVVINEPAAITFTTAVNETACFGSCDGIMSVAAAGGLGPYEIDWFNTNSTLTIGSGASISELCPGTYFASILDANGCIQLTDTLEVTSFPEIILATTNITDASCGQSDGSITISATGGGGTFSYLWTPGTIVGQGTTAVSQLAGGLYQAVVTDANNCSDSITVPISSGALEVLTLTATDVSCFNQADGFASASFTCLELNCTVEWINEAGSVLGTNNTISNLTAGTYYFELTNGLGCTVLDSITITEPDEIEATISSTNILCSGNATGTATVTTAISNLFYTWGPIPNGGQGTTQAVGLTAGLWTVEVSDINGCKIDLSTNISEPPPILIDNLDAQPISCAGDNDGSVSVIASGGTAALTYSWFACGSGAPAGTGAFIAGLAPGDYFVIITDGNNCTLTSACVTVEDRNPITTINTTVNASCFAECNGRISTSPSGGDGTYFYQWKDANQLDLIGQTNDSISNLCQGNYFLEITDGSGCATLFGPIDLTQPAAPWDVSVTTADVSCFSDCDGSALVTVNAGNTAPYNFSWSDPVNQSINEVINLCAGTYQVLITDQVNCDTTISIQITEPAEIATNAAQTNVLCADECTGEITITPSGGQAPYGINWSNGDMGPTATDLCAGTITVGILDNAGCVADETFTISEPSNPITVISTFQNISQCNECNGSATVNITGGSLPYTYNWSVAAVTGQGTNHVTGLCSGFVSVTITDANGCQIVESFLIEDVNGDAFTLNATDASCFDICDGTATITPTCTVPFCTQAWFDAQTGIQLLPTGTTISSLCQGDYIVELTNGAGCVSGDTFSISSPDGLFINATVADVTCSGNSDGSVVTAASGGSGGYIYTWTPTPANGNGNSSATGLTGGAIDLLITDASNCIIQESYTVIDTTPIVLTTLANNVICNGFCNGNITVTASGGFGNYTYQWLNGGIVIPNESSSSVFNLCPGSYNVIVTDGNGCSQTLVNPVIITEPSQVSAAINSTDISCFGLCDGTATVAGSGGQGPYIYNWFNGANSLIGQTASTATALCADNYFAIITDANNCSVTTSFAIITEPTELNFTVTQTDIDCFDDCNGSGQMTISGGVPNYVFEWKNTATNVVIGTTDNISNLCAGSYSIEAVDQNGCSTGINAVNIISPALLTVNVLTNNAECSVPSGSAIAQVSGGIPLYSYQWLDQNQAVIAGETNNSLQNILSGTYFVVVEDANNCDDTIQFVVEENPNTTIQFDAVNNPSCFGGNDGSIDITIIGNNLPLNFLWNAGGTVVEDPTNLTAGAYTLTVTDALGCESFYDTVLTEPSPLLQTPTIVDPLCGECDGSVSVAVTGGLAPYTYNWNTGATVDNIQNLCGGIYQLNIEDANGCVVDQPYAVGNSTAVTAEAVVTPISCFDLCDAEITINILSGTAPFTVNWLNDGFNGLSQQNLCADTYFIEVIDAAGCVFPLVVELDNPNEIIGTPTMVLPNCGATDGEISVVTTGGVLPHAYSWSAPPSNTSTISNVGAGVYILTVTDNNGTGCSQDFTFNLSNISVPQVVLSKSDIDCNGNCDGEISSVTTGGTPNYTYQWFEDDGALIVGENNSSLLNLCAGTYSIEVTDANGCLAYSTEFITEPSAINFNNPNVTNVSCFGDCNGSIAVNSFGGTLPYAFQWDDANNQVGAVANNLCDGTYTLTLTDGNGCEATIIDSVLEPPVLSVTIDSITEARCKETFDGNIQATITGGTLNYTINWTNEIGQSFNTEDVVGVLPTTYFLLVTDANGCTVQDTAIIDTAVVVFVDAGLDTVICFSEEASLLATSNQIAADYTWYDGSSTVVGSSNIYLTGELSDGIYAFVAQATFDGCDDFDTVQVSVGILLTVEAGDDLELKLNSSGEIGGDPTATVPGQFIWTPSIYLSDTTVSNPEVQKPQEDTWYYLEFIDSIGCTAFDSVYVEVVPELTVPEGISPNGDGKNDTWIIEFNEDFPNLEVSVYNRWGELLFYDNSGYQVPWDGTYKGQPLPVGTYYYVVELNSELFPEPFVGPLTILR